MQFEEFENDDDVDAATFLSLQATSDEQQKIIHTIKHEQNVACQAMYRASKTMTEFYRMYTATTRAVDILYIINK